MAYTPQAGDNIVLNLSGDYTPPPGGAIILGDAPVVVATTTSGIVIAWGQYPAKEKRTSVAWQEKRFVGSSISLGYLTKILPVTAGVAVVIKEGKSIAADHETSWQTAIPEKHAATTIVSRNPPAKGRKTITAWQSEIPPKRKETSIVFRNPAAKERKIDLRYRELAAQSSAKVIRYGNPPAVCFPHQSVWGPKYYAEICKRKYKYPAGDKIILNLHIPLKEVGDGSTIFFYQEELSYDRRCAQREPSGRRDAYFYIRPAKPLSAPWSKVYTMLNTAQLSRLPERTVVDLVSITLNTDWDSLYWSGNATLGSDQALSLLEPVGDDAMAIEAIVNGHTWWLQVDKTSNSEAFGSKSRSINFRSLAAQLGAPDADARTYTETYQRSALQLMQQELENTGWDVAFDDGIEDWLVPANVLSYQNLTPMQVVKLIADCPQAIVQTHLKDQSILIRPRYKVKPWAISSATPDIVIPSVMAATRSMELDKRQFFNAVHIRGEEGGISATVTREGSAGDLFAPDVVDKLITATEVATARGIVELGKSGKWRKRQLELPVFVPPDLPGIILPGTIIRYDFGQTFWQGFVSANSVTASRDNRALKVRQNISVEQYIGN